MVDTFYRLVPLADATAVTIYNQVKSCLQEDNLSITKLIESCSLDKEKINYVKERCKNFVVELINQVQIRLPDNVETLLMLKSFHPSNATSQCKSSIVPIACRYKSTFQDIDELENEWSNLSFVQWPAACLGSTVSFWAEVNDHKTSAGEKKIPNVASLALSLLSLPLSNASIEIIFSQMNVVHSKLRNRLTVRSVEAILQIRYGLSLQSLSCVTFMPSPDMLENFSATKDPEKEEVDSDVEEILSLDIE
ncbi:hypothetical protein Pmani_013167 [Petrolisthes manimaculis]|uniref:HAT C-terminal dimerisation domain-containing protein n=1 Tax=Petrolisthes manimaculis TaxID=1843537 RepID=A0AAE1U9K7_9EUCA|nr:hypothetical protein Pmani_013167 [Petrolisthes manimaculis]